MGHETSPHPIQAQFVIRRDELAIINLQIKVLNYTYNLT